MEEGRTNSRILFSYINPSIHCILKQMTEIFADYSVLDEEKC